MKREATLPPVSPPKAVLSEEELEKKSKAIIEEYLHLNDMKVGSWRELSDGRVGCGSHADCFPSYTLCPCRKQCSVCRSWPHPPCSLSLSGMASSPHWSAVPLLVNVWDSCCTSCSVPGTSPLLSTTKGMTDFCGPPLFIYLRDFPPLLGLWILG